MRNILNPRNGGRCYWLLVLISIYLMLLITHASDHHHDDDEILISHHNEDEDPYRTAFHFQPPNYWMNDPNGPVIYKGIYHLFYQYYPHDVAWHTEIVWGHSTSTDLINWKPQPIALSPSEPYDINGCWSGSITILPNEHKPAILYTSIDHQKNQVQNLAFPKDSSEPYLKQWVKAPQNPVMFGTPANSNNINASEFRDPTTAWKLKSDGKWRIIVGTQQGKRGIAVVFTSDDFLNWSYVDQPFHSVEGTGIWECPDFFPVYVGKSVGADTSVVGDEVKHVLKVSLFDTQYEYYTIGGYDTVNDVYVPDEGSVESDLGLRLDYGKFYASKSFFDDKINRRVLWGWVNESSTSADDIKKGWSGIQAIPRTIVLDKSGKQLVHWPVTEVETLRENPAELLPQVIRGGSLVEISGVTASQADVEISFKIPESNHVEKLDPTWTNPQILCSEKGTSNKGRIGPFGLLTLASEGLEEYTAVFFRIFKAQNNHVVLMCSRPKQARYKKSQKLKLMIKGEELALYFIRSSLNPTTDKLCFGTFVDVDPLSEELSLRILIDHSIVESFGANGKNCITARVYPTLAIHEKAKLYAFNYGSEDVEITKFIAWSMKRAQINNLTSQKSSNNHKSKVGNEEL